MSGTRTKSIVVAASAFLAVIAVAWLVYQASARRVSRAAEPPRAPAPIAEPAPEAAFVAPVSKRGRGGETYFLPADCAPAEFDAVLHFHGAEPTMGDAIARAELRAAAFVSNQGTSSDGYRDAYSGEGSLERVIAALQAELSRHCAGPRRVARVAVSSWSAGFAAVQQLIRTDSQRARLDAVLLADSLHAAFMDPAARHIGDTQLQGFVEFARAAARGEKLMLVTHSSIQTEGYASTTETADFLLRAVGLERSSTAPDLSTAKRGGFLLFGRPGRDEAAHVKELKAFGTELFPELERRWQPERRRRPR